MRIPQILAELRKESKLSQAEVAKYFTEHGKPITVKSISRWEQGATSPDIEQFLLLCQLYGVSDVLSVFGVEDSPVSLNDLGCSKLVEYMRLLQSNDRYVRRPISRKLMRSIPLYDMPVSAGTGQFLDSDHYELIEVDESIPLDATFALRITGDSMEPQYKNGQIIYIKPQPTLERGELGVFIHDGNAFFKRLGGKNRTELISLNKEYPPRIVGENDDLRVVGKVLA